MAISGKIKRNCNAVFNKTCYHKFSEGELFPLIYMGAIGVGAFENMHHVNKVGQDGGKMHEQLDDKGANISL